MCLIFTFRQTEPPKRTMDWTFFAYANLEPISSLKVTFCEYPKSCEFFKTNSQEHNSMKETRLNEFSGEYAQERVSLTVTALILPFMAQTGTF